MENDKGTAQWYTPVIRACYHSDEKMSDVGFLRLFAAAMCMPCCKNYKNTQNRTAGAASKETLPPPQQIWDEQNKLLKDCARAMEHFDVTGKTRKQRTNNIGEMLTRSTSINDVYEYAKKNEHYTPGRFLSMYLYPLQHLSDAAAEAVFLEVQEYYKSLLTGIFETMPEDLEEVRRNLRCQLTALEPDCPVPDHATAWDDVAWHLSALLILGASKACEDIDCKKLKFTLLGIIPPEESATRSILYLDHVTMTTSQFYTLCSAALRSDPELETLRTVFDMLDSVRQQVDGQLEHRACELVNTFIEVLKAFYDKKMAASNDDWLNPAPTDEIQVVQYLARECTKWIN